MATIPGVPGAGDIVHFGKRVYQAHEALSAGPNGAQRHYQQATSGLAQRLRAEEDWIVSTTNPATRNALETIRNEDRALQDDLAPSGKHLGRSAKMGFQHGMASKLKWGFITDKSVREHNDRLRPAMDATMLQLARSNAVQMEASFDKIGTIQEMHFQALKTMSTDILRQLPNKEIRQDILAIQHELAQLRVSSSAVPASMATIPQASGTVSCPSKHTPELRFATVAHSPPAVMRTCAETVTGSYLANCSDTARQIALEFVQVVFAVAMTATYQALRPRKASSSIAAASPEDILHACMLGYAVFALFGSLRRVPRLIEGMSDDSIGLQTALGQDIKIPSLHWREYPVFHGFLESYFRDRPGSSWVARKSYRILLGGTGGMVVDESKWSLVVSKNLRLTMAILLDESHKCPRCHEYLDTRNYEEKYCGRCAETFRAVQQVIELPGNPKIGMGNTVAIGIPAKGAEPGRFAPLPPEPSVSVQSIVDESIMDEVALFVHVLLLNLASQPTNKTTGIRDARSKGFSLDEQDGILTVPAGYQHDADLLCPFQILDCEKVSTDIVSFKNHVFTHFRGHQLPTIVSCFLCDKKFAQSEDDDDAWSWNQMLSHMTYQHYRQGQQLATVRTDFALMRWMDSRRLINDHQFLASAATIADLVTWKEWGTRRDYQSPLSTHATCVRSSVGMLAQSRLSVGNRSEIPNKQEFNRLDVDR